MSAEAALYTPFEAPYRMSMGLISMPWEEWFELDDSWADDVREKRRLLAERHDELVRTLPASETGQQEVLRRLVAHLTQHFPDRFQKRGPTLRLPELDETWDLDRPKLALIDLAGRLVQEDLCLMQRDATAWRLTAASVCFPTRWNLASKMGQALDDIHGPVPGFEERLARPVTRFFDHMKVDKPVWRINWSLIDDPALYQPKGHGIKTADPSITPENAGDRVWLRVERQTLARLPDTDSILFTIRIHRWPLARLAALPEAVTRLRQAMETMPPDLQQYKSMPVFGAAVREYLIRLEA